MKFISKNANLRVVLKNGISAEPINGRSAIAGLYIKFQDGLVDVEDLETAELMKSHSGFGSDFIEAPENGPDPYEETRTESEPVHQITEIKYGTPGKTTSSPSKVKLNPEMKKILESAAKEMALKMAPELAIQMLEKMSKDKKIDPEEVKEDKPEEIEEDEPKVKTTSKKTITKK